jgi:hypothetical protein
MWRKSHCISPSAIIVPKMAVMIAIAMPIQTPLMLRPKSNPNFSPAAAAASQINHIHQRGPVGSRIVIASSSGLLAGASVSWGP